MSARAVFTISPMPAMEPISEAMSAGTMTVFFNGVLVQDNAEILGATAHAAKAKYSAHEAELPIGLQDHGDPLKFRNAWIRPLTN